MRFVRFCFLVGGILAAPAVAVDPDAVDDDDLPVHRKDQNQENFLLSSTYSEHVTAIYPQQDKLHHSLLRSRARTDGSLVPTIRGHPALSIDMLSAETAFASSSSSSNANNSTGLCDRIPPGDLPIECSCQDTKPLSLIIDCEKPFDDSEFFNDTIGMTIDIDLCNPDGSTISLDITELNHGFRYTIAGITAGDDELIPLPGLSIVVPSLGHLGLDAVVKIRGNPDMLTLMIGLDACMAVGPKKSSHHHEICASSIPGVSRILPWWVLSGTYSFGNVCNTTNVADAAVDVAADAAGITESSSEEMAKVA